MVTSSSIDEKDFGREHLDSILEWVVGRFTPEELYGDKELREFISANYSPDEIFDMAELEEAVEG